MVIQFSTSASAKINEAIHFITSFTTNRQHYLPQKQLLIDSVLDTQFDENIKHDWLRFSPMKLWYGLCSNGMDLTLVTHTVYPEVLPLLREILDILQNSTVDPYVYLNWFLTIDLSMCSKADNSIQNMITLVYLCQRWLNTNSSYIDHNKQLSLQKDNIRITPNDFFYPTSLLLLKIVTFTCTIFNACLIFPIKAFIFVPGVIHIVFASDTEVLVLEMTSREINRIEQNTEIFHSLFHYKTVTKEFESPCWRKENQTYETLKNTIWAVDTHILPLNHYLFSDSSCTYTISDKEINDAAVRSRLRAEKQLGIILDDYKVELIDSAKSNLWFEISEYFFWWFCSVQGIQKELQMKQCMNAGFTEWIVMISHLIFVGDWAKSYPLLRSIEIHFYTGPAKNYFAPVHNNVLLPLRDEHHVQYCVNGIYKHGLIQADPKSNWTKIPRHIILFMDLSHTYPEVMMWLLNTNIKLNKKFVKSIHPLFSTGTLTILHVKYDEDILLSFISKIFPNVYHQGWILVKQHIKDSSPISSEPHKFQENEEN